MSKSRIHKGVAREFDSLFCKFDELKMSAIQRDNSLWFDWNNNLASEITDLFHSVSSHLPQRRVTVDFIEGLAPFVSKNFTEALIGFTVPRETEYGDRHYFGSVGFSKLEMLAVAECQNASRKLRQSQQKVNEDERELHLRLEEALFGDMSKQLKAFRNGGDTPKPLTQAEMIDLLGGQYSQKEISNLVKKSEFKSQKGYRAKFNLLFSDGYVRSSKELSVQDCQNMNSSFRGGENN